MKPIQKLTACILLIVTATFLSCKRENPVNNTSNYYPPPSLPPPSSAHEIKARVIEYGTDRPISGVSISLWLIPGGYLNTTTDANGECFFDGKEFASFQLTAANHWYYYGQNPSASIVFYPGNMSFDYYSGGAISCDSFLVKLFPITYITVHIKDSLLLPLLDLSDHLIFAVNASFNLNSTNYTVYSGGSSNQDGEIVRLRRGIDTTFQYPVFGNTNNLFSVGEDEAANGWAGFGNFIHQETKYIQNNSNNLLRITF